MLTKKTKETTYSATSIGDKLEGLFELQCVDSEIDQLKILRGQLPLEVTDLEEAIGKLNDRLQTQSDSELEFKNSITEQKQKIKDSKILITKYNSQQEKVRNNREFDAISKELEFQG